MSGRLLSVKANEREAAPVDVWDIDRPPTWHSVIWALISDFAESKIQHAFLRAPPEYLVSDDLSWLDSLVLEVHGRS